MRAQTFAALLLSRQRGGTRGMTYHCLQVYSIAYDWSYRGVTDTLTRVSTNTLTRVLTDTLTRVLAIGT